MTDERTNRNARNASGASRASSAGSASSNPRLRTQTARANASTVRTPQRGVAPQRRAAVPRVESASRRMAGANASAPRVVNPNASDPRYVEPENSQGRRPRAPMPNEPQDKKSKGGCFWRSLFWLALIVFVVSAGALAFIGYTYWQGQKSYDEIASEAFAAPESNTLADFEVDWGALREINPDVVGWIYMPGTEINYPIAWRDGDDEYYLYHNFNGESSAEFGAEYGSIMLSGVNRSDFSDAVNIVYGHHMANGTMFAILAKLQDDADEFNSHRLVYLLTPEGNYLLQAFSVVHVPGSSDDIIIPNFASDVERTAYMQDKIDRSIVEVDPAGSPAEEITKTFAMVTCDGADRSYRYITYCEVVEFCPIGSVGPSSGELGDAGGSLSDGSMVSTGDLDAVGDAATDRTA